MATKPRAIAIKQLLMPLSSQVKFDARTAAVSKAKHKSHILMILMTGNR
jgi:hypothetical protein